MAIFDESDVVAGHQKLAASISAEYGALGSSCDIIQKAIMHADVPRNDAEEHANFIHGSLLVQRIANSAGASSTLIDRGYFVQSAAHMRDIAETAMLVLAFSEDVDQLTKWRGMEGKERYTHFGRSPLKKMISSSNQSKYSWLNSHFDKFSEYGGHPSAISVIAHHDSNRFHLGPHVNRELYINTYKELARLTWHATDACKGLWHKFTAEDIEDIFTEEISAFRAAWDKIAP